MNRRTWIMLPLLAGACGGVEPATGILGGEEYVVGGGYADLLEDTLQLVLAEVPAACGDVPDPSLTSVGIPPHPGIFELSLLPANEMIVFSGLVDGESLVFAEGVVAIDAIDTEHGVVEGSLDIEGFGRISGAFNVPVCGS